MGDPPAGRPPLRSAVLRDVVQGQVWRAHACHVIEEHPDRIALFVPRGGPARLPVDDTGARVRVPPTSWRLVESQSARDSLGLFRSGTDRSVWLFWEDGRRVPGWYVNFEEPLHRTPIGFDYRDLMLDLLVEPDGRWRWKDEAELEQAHGRGLLDAAAVRAAARRALDDPAWPTGWEDWRPDPTWPLPSLPAGWEDVSEA